MAGFGENVSFRIFRRKKLLNAFRPMVGRHGRFKSWCKYIYNQVVRILFLTTFSFAMYK